MNIWKKRLRQLAIAAGLIGALTGMAYAVTQQFAPRQFNTQQTHYMRFEFDFNSCVPVSNTCSVKVGAVPYNSWLTTAFWQVNTVFNSATSDQIGIATTSGGNDLVGRSNVHTGVAQTVSTLSLATGTSVVGAGAAQTGADGGFDIYVVYTSVGTAPTTGKATFLLNYAAPNDGTCTTVPMGTTAAAC